MKPIVSALSALSLLPVFPVLPLHADPEQPLLPKTLWAAPEVELNLYFDNLPVPGVEALLPDVHCGLGKQFAKRWSYLPKAEDPGAFELTLNLTDPTGMGGKPLEGRTTIRVARRDAGAGKAVRLLAVGDSLTATGGYTGALLKLCSGPHNPTLTLLGSRTGDDLANRHEGHPGWTWQRFLTSGKESPFFFPDSTGRPTFDPAQYLQTHCDGQAPDFIVLFLGTNDSFGLSAENREERLSTAVAGAGKLVDAFRSVAPNAAIGLILPLPPASQDAFGENYDSGETRHNYVTSTQRFNEAMQRQFSNREQEGFYLIPARFSFDSEHNYPTQERPVHQRSSRKALPQINALHPTMDGYRQIADSVYAWMKNGLTQDDQ